MALFDRSLSRLKKKRVAKVDAPTVRGLIAASGGGLTAEQVDDRVAGLLVAGTNVTLTYNDGANTLTVDASGGGTTNLAYTASTRLLESSTGADVTLPLVVAGGDAGLMTGADKTKLNGVATGATANSADATLLARANHTGSQLAATISDFASAVAALITGKQNTILSGTATVTPDRQAMEWRETVAAVGVTGSSRISLDLGSHADTDENDPELLDIGAISAIPGTNTITFILAFLTPTAGPIKLNWSAL
jgi:hypothetical protein